MQDSLDHCTITSILVFFPLNISSTHVLPSPWLPKTPSLIFNMSLGAVLLLSGTAFVNSTMLRLHDYNSWNSKHLEVWQLNDCLFLPRGVTFKLESLFLIIFIHSFIQEIYIECLLLSGKFLSQ